MPYTIYQHDPLTPEKSQQANGSDDADLAAERLAPSPSYNLEIGGKNFQSEKMIENVEEIAHHSYQSIFPCIFKT